MISPTHQSQYLNYFVNPVLMTESEILLIVSLVQQQRQQTCQIQQ